MAGNLNALQLSFIGGIASLSYFIFANIGTAFFGVVPALEAIDHVNLSVAQRVGLWKWYYDKAKFHFAISTLTSAASFATASTLSSSPSNSRLLIGAAAMSFSVVPFTLIFMLPVNNELGDMVKNKSLESDRVTAEEATVIRVRALDRIEKWKQLHMVRLLLGSGAWIGGLAALFCEFSF